MAYMQEGQHYTKRIKLEGRLDEFRTALEQEIATIKSNGQSSILLKDGRQVNSLGNGLWYRFKVDYASGVPADTPCKLWIGREQFDVTVVNFDEDTIILAAQRLLPDTLGIAQLENGTTNLLEKMVKCIEENAETENHVGERMFSIGPDVYPVKKIAEYGDWVSDSEYDKYNDEQKQAITASLTNDITYIWGPPGTGKSTVIGQIINELYKHGRSVLLVSHTNTAVDGAIKKAYEDWTKISGEQDEICPILRLGECCMEKVSLKAHIAREMENLTEQEAYYKKQQEEIQESLEQTMTDLAKISWLRKSKLEEIGAGLDKIGKYGEQREIFLKEQSDINAAIQKEKTLHPEGTRYLALAKRIKAQKAEKELYCAKIEQGEKHLARLALQTQNAQNELRKHSRYKELKEQEAKYMPFSFLQGEYNKVDKNVANIKNIILCLEKQKRKEQQIIADYETKSSVAKFFTGKGALTQAQLAIGEIEQQLQQNRRALQIQEGLEEEYSKQLKEILLIQEQMKTVIPSETPVYWEREIQKNNSALLAVQKEQSQLEKKRKKIVEEISSLEEQLLQAKPSFEILSDYGRSLQQIAIKIEKTNKLYREEKERCEQELGREVEQCSLFFSEWEMEESSLLFAKLSELYNEVKIESNTINEAEVLKQKESTDNLLLDIAQKLEELQQKKRGLEKRTIMQAKIIGTTLTQSYLNSSLRERKFDTVILDEASMAPVPALWCASYLAENNIVIVGDFLQLPPIVMARGDEAKKWLGHDIFWHSKMQEKWKNKNTPDNFVALKEQYRMEKDIADVANMYYEGELKTKSDAARKKKRNEFYEWYSEDWSEGEQLTENIHLIDTESLHAWVTSVPQGKSHSRINYFSAAVDVELAFGLLDKKLEASSRAGDLQREEASVLIIAPYKPHVRYIEELISLEYKNRGLPENSNFIKAGTIHKFQGNEADVVIFDLVVDEPHWRTNLFRKDEETNENLRKMFNVAITRAKFKLFIVGNFAYCQKRAKDNALSDLLNKLLTGMKLPKIEAKKILPTITFARKTGYAFSDRGIRKTFLCSEADFSDYFMKDIYSCTKHLIIYSPFMTEQRLGMFLPAFADAQKAGKKIIIVTKALSERGKTERGRYEKCEKALRDIKVHVLHKQGMHEKLIFIDDKVVWIGSLNVLSYTGLTGEIMQRQEMEKDAFKKYSEPLGIEYLYEICEKEKEFEQKCPVCKGEMLIGESMKGGIYWKCINGDYSRSVTQPYPVDGMLYCKDCGAPYTFAMKKEPRWVCTKNVKHYQVMREGDLRLEKMKRLIPTAEARNEVKKYFENNKKGIASSKSMKEYIPSSDSEDGRQISLSDMGII